MRVCSRDVAVAEIFQQELPQLVDALAQFESRGAVYAVVGGLALDAWLAKPFAFLRANGTLRDIDIVVLEDPWQEVKRFARECEELYRSKKASIPVDFNFAKTISYRDPLQILPHIKRHNISAYSLVFRDINMPLDDGVLKVHSVSVPLPQGNPVTVSSFHPDVLLHLYGHRIGSLKRKDKRKVWSAVRVLKERRFLVAEDHGRYRVFHRFGQAIRTQYPRYHASIRVYDYLDYVCGGRLTHLIPRGIFYRLTDI